MRSEPPKKSFLDDCLVDSPNDAQNNRKPVRRRAMTAALLFEAATLCGLALWPLLTTARLPAETVVVAVPSRVSFTPPDLAHAPLAPRNETAERAPLFEPSHVPVHIFRAAVAAAPSAVPPLMGNFGTGTGMALSGVPFGIGNGTAAVALPRPAPAVRVIRRSEGFEEGQLLKRVVPTYPQLARIARISGTVELLVLVGRDGRVRSVQVLSGSALLAAPAKAAVEQWQYRPAILDGQAVEVETHVTVHFVLDE